MPSLRSRLRQWRARRGWTQQELAERAGVTRQTIGGIEAGRYGPGVEVGLRLARALGCRIEDLFELDDDVALAPVVGCAAPSEGDLRVVLAEIGGRTVARSLTGLGAYRWPVPAAHGIAAARGESGGRHRIRRLGGAGAALFLAGCDPALGLLAAHVTRSCAGVDALWWQAGNAAAAAQLRRGEVHAAALHAPSGDAAADAPSWTRYRVAGWRMGWLVPAGNPKGIRGAADLGRGDLVLANREPGAGARTLLDRLLGGAGVAATAVRGYDRLLPGHAAVAEAVAMGAADVGLGADVAARQAGLDFLPVSAEVCDLCLPREHLEGTAAALLDTLCSAAFRADLAAFGDYDTSETGDRVA